MDLTYKLGEAEKQPLTVKLPDEVVKNSATASIEDEGKQQEHEDDKSHDELDWQNAGGVFIGVNIVVIGLIVALVIMIKKRRARK